MILGNRNAEKNMKNLPSVLLAVSIIYICSFDVVYADVPVEMYEDFKETGDWSDAYLTGVGRGIFWTNVLLGVKNKLQLFCMPKKLSLDKGIILSVIDQEIRNPTSGKAYDEGDPIEMIAVYAFINKFPCE